MEFDVQNRYSLMIREDYTTLYNPFINIGDYKNPDSL